MKHTTGPRRGRPRGNGKRFSSGKNHTIESNGPDVKIRGSAQQVCDKYLSLARDALVSGDRIGAEGYFQYADHYHRIVSAANGNAANRQDRNNRIPPPPDQNAGKIVLENGDESAAKSANEAPSNAADGGQARPKVIDVPIVEAGADAAVLTPAADETRPAVNADSAPPDHSGATGSQAEELAQALAKSTADLEDPAVAPAADPGQPVSEPAPAESGPKRRRRSPLGIGPKRAPRRRQQKNASDEAVEASAGSDGPTVKTVRRRPRKAAAEEGGSAAESN